MNTNSSSTKKITTLQNLDKDLEILEDDMDIDNYNDNLSRRIDLVLDDREIIMHK